MTKPQPAKLVAKGLLTSEQAARLFQGDVFLRKYKLLEFVGAGGMGVIYKALHVVMNRTVAVKFIAGKLLESPAARKRFRREIQAAAALKHPNIVQAYDADRVENIYVLVMEYVDGLNLRKCVERRGPLPIDLACEFSCQVARGLQYAYETRKMVHRDIKPSNLIVARDNTVRILDFGLARLTTDALSKNALAVSGQAVDGQTLKGRIVGTPDFVAPEQIEDPRSADIRSDIYSLGCTLFFLLTKRPPFPGKTPAERMSRRLRGEAPSVKSLRNEIPLQLRYVVAKALSQSPDRRYQTPEEFGEALHDCLESTRRAGATRAPRPDKDAPEPRDERGPGAARLARRAAAVAVPALLFVLALLGFLHARKLDEPLRWATVEAFSGHPYHVPWKSVRGASTTAVPLETNGEVTGVRLRSLDNPQASPAVIDRIDPSQPELGRFTSRAVIDSDRLRPGRYSLAIEGKLGATGVFEADKEVRVGEDELTIERVSSLSGPQGTLRLEIPRPRTVLVTKDGERIRGKEGVFEVPYDLARQRNCSYPVEGSEDDVLVPLIARGPWGTRPVVLHRKYRTNAALLRPRMRLVGDQVPRDRTQPLTACAGGSLDLHYSGLGLQNIELRVSLAEGTTEVFCDQAPVDRHGLYELQLPRAPGSYSLEVEWIAEGTVLAEEGPWPLKVEPAVGPPVIALVDRYRKRVLAGRELGGTPVEAKHPAYLVTSEIRSARCTVDGKPVGLASLSENSGSFAVEHEPDGGPRSRVRLERPGAFDSPVLLVIDWSAAPRVECAVLTVPCPNEGCLDGTEEKRCAGIRYLDECSICEGASTVDCPECRGSGFRDLEAQPEFEREAETLRRRVEAARWAWTRARRAGEARREILETRLQGQAIPKRALEGWEEAERAYWQALHLVREGRYDDASRGMETARRLYGGIEFQETPGHRKWVEGIRRKREEELAARHRVENQRQLSRFARRADFRGIVRKLRWEQRGGTARTVMVYPRDRALDERGALAPENIGRVLGLAGSLLRPDDPAEALADRLVFEPPAGLTSLGREELRVVRKLVAQGGFVLPAPGGRRGFGVLLWYLVSSLFLMAGLFVARSAILESYRRRRLSRGRRFR